MILFDDINDDLFTLLQDERFNREIDLQTGYRTKALLCMPIKDVTGDVVGVAQVINKLNGDSFTENDEKVSRMCCMWFSYVVLHQTQISFSKSNTLPFPSSEVSGGLHDVAMVFVIQMMMM